MSTATRTCPSCVATLPGDAVFCHKCGTATPMEIIAATGEIHAGNTLVVEEAARRAAGSWIRRKLRRSRMTARGNSPSARLAVSRQRVDELQWKSMGRVLAFAALCIAPAAWPSVTAGFTGTSSALVTLLVSIITVGFFVACVLVVAVVGESLASETNPSVVQGLGELSRGRSLPPEAITGMLWGYVIADARASFHFQNHMKTIARMAAATLAIAACSRGMNASQSHGWISLFDGQTLVGWRASENPATFRVENGEIIVHGPRAHLFYDGPAMNHEFKDFEVKADVLTKPGANSGIFIRTTYQDTGFPSKGYEVQVNNSQSDWRRTGSLYAVQDVREAGRDNEWFTIHTIVRGRRVQIMIDDRQVVDYTEPDSSRTRLTGGTIALQGHDPASEVHYKNVMIRPLP